MKESIWGWAVVFVGIIAIFFVYFFQSVTNTDEHNYNLLKDVTESAMVDALDKATYMKKGIIFMDGDKFVENFVRRFADAATLSRDYEIKIYDVSELPPKVSLQVSSKNEMKATNEVLEFDISNRLDAILEVPYSGADIEYLKFKYPNASDEELKRLQQILGLQNWMSR